MDKREATDRLKQLFKGFKGLRDAFHTEQEFLDFHLQFILDQCGGTWDNDKAKQTVDLLARSQ